MKIREAVAAVQSGRRVARAAWDKTKWLARVNDRDPYVNLYVDGDGTSWRPSHDDLAANDWFVLHD